MATEQFRQILNGTSGIGIRQDQPDGVPLALR
jgi:hypothetical protein